MERAIVLLSGGVDSAVALWWAKKQGWDIRPLTFDYFGRPKRENEAVRALTSQAETAPIRHVDLPFLKEVDDLRKEGFENRILLDRKSTRLNSSHSQISYAVFCLKKKTNSHRTVIVTTRTDTL